MLMVGPGLMPIPTPGWGAIETVIWELATALRARGHSVEILNQPGLRPALRSAPWRYDIVHCHYDPHVSLWLRLKEFFGFRLIATSHSPRMASDWSDTARRSFAGILRCPEHFALNDAIAARLTEASSAMRVRVVPNGVDVTVFRTAASGNGRAVCLGRWEERKRQAELWSLLEAEGVPCDFVGPGAEGRGLQDGSFVRYLGPWERRQVQERLCEYSALVLPSTTEAHALVTLEAQAAGLPVVVTPGAAAHLPSRPWVLIREFGVPLAEALRQAISLGSEVRGLARAHAEAEWSWAAVAARYEDACND